MYADTTPGTMTRDPNATRVAGLLDLEAMLKLLGTAYRKTDLAAIKRAAKAAPEELYGDEKMFVDPRGRLMYDTGMTYTGKPLPQSESLNELMQQGNTLQDYLSDTEIGGLLGSHLKDIHVGQTNLPAGYAAGFTPPTYVNLSDGTRRVLQPGFLAVGKSTPAHAVAPLFEHEMQHAYQGLLGMPQGTNLDAMSGDMVTYLQEIGALRPAQLSRIDKLATETGASKPFTRYSATTGEAEARAAEIRAERQMLGQTLGVPTPSDYLWTHGNPTLSQNMLFDITPDVEQGFQQWWKNKWAKP